MASPVDEIDFASLIAPVTDALDEDTPPASSSPTAGFTLHKVKMGRHKVLVKVFSGLPQGCLSPSESRIISKAFLRELGIWKHKFSSDFFAHIIGRSEYVDSILPCPVYLQTTLAREYLKEHKNAHLLNFFYRISQGIEILHQNNVIHGDIRGDNILVGSDGVPRVSDYSLTRIVCLLDKHGYRGKTDVTPATRWMPPEFMYLEDDVPYTPSKQGDIWSLGMTIFELWSGNMPYLGTSLERVPDRVRQGRLPSFSGELMPSLEAIREGILFVCGLCWKKHPADRKAAAELVHIFRELIEGKSVSSISREFESREQRQSIPTRRINSLRISGDSSVSSSSKSTYSETESMEARSMVSPSEYSDSGYETVTGQSRSKRTTVKIEETDETSSVSSWSHTNQPQGRSGNGPGVFLPARNTQTDRRPISDQRQSDDSILLPFNAFPPPPPPNSPLSSVSSWMTALLNYKAKHKLTAVNIERRSAGEPHQPSFTTICRVNGQEYARATDFKKKRADEAAAQETLTRLYNENPSLASEAFPSYVSSFKSYLAEHGLTNRIGWRYDRHGEAHNPMWTCTLLRDGRNFSRGTAAVKEKAAEEAAKEAAVLWITE